MAALAAGKDVFCEKPTLTIREGRELVDVVKKQKAVFQAGLEDRSVRQYHALCEAVRNGAIGQLKHIDVELPVHKKVYREARQAPPKDLDWNMWQGPAPWAEYSPQRVDWMGWRMIRDYSGGILTDWGAHLVDSALVANFAEKSGPVEIKGRGEIPDGVMNTAKKTFDVHYRFANDVTMRVVSKGVRLRFEGTEGWCGNEGWRAEPKAHDQRNIRPTRCGLCPTTNIATFSMRQSPARLPPIPRKICTASARPSIWGPSPWNSNGPSGGIPKRSVSTTTHEQMHFAAAKPEIGPTLELVFTSASPFPANNLPVQFYFPCRAADSSSFPRAALPMSCADSVFANSRAVD